MSKSRMINTRFWDDAYISNLDPIEKLMFLYFLTNTSTNISGIYEIPIKKIANETGIDKEMVLKILERFSKDQKIFYYNGWICLKNFIKNQNQGSPKVQIGIKNEIDLIPQDIMDIFIGYGYPIAFNLIKSNIIKYNLNTNATTKVVDKKPIKNKKPIETESKEIPLIFFEFESLNPAVKKMYGNKTQRQACVDLIKTYTFEKTIQVIKDILPQIKGQPFFPEISTPYELFNKWSKLESAIMRYGKEKNIKTKIAF